MSRNNDGYVRFGDYEFDSHSGKLLRDGFPVKIQPQPLRVLEVLVEQPGKIVSREELRTRVWGESTFVEFDQGLNYCIRQIRLALRDEAADPVYIETLPKQGYRFLADVHCPDRAEQVQDPFPASVIAGGSSRRMLAVAALATSVVLIAASSWWNATRSTISSDAVKPVRMSKVTSFPGQETDPAISPKGTLVAFSWDGERGDNRDIYVMPLGSQTPVRLTQDPAADISPAWSPDGSQIGFLRLDTVSKGRLVVIPSDGGSERTIREVRLREDIDRAMRPLLAWTPDGKGIAYATQDDELERTSLYVTDLQGTTLRRLFVADEASMGAAAPAFSRDGKWLAYTTVYGPYQARLFVRPLGAGLQAGDAVPVTEPGGSMITSPIWAPDNRHLLFTQGSSILEWESGRTPRQVFVGPKIAGMSAVWGPGQALRMVTADSDHVEIRMIPLAPGGLAASGNAVAFAPSTTTQANPQFSPDGKHLVFLSTRSGAFEIWVTDADGRNAHQATHLNATMTGFPRWSRDSKRVAFHAWLGSTKPQVYTIDVERILGTGDGKSGDAVKRVTDAAFGFLAPTWSADGKYLYADRLSGGTKVFRFPADGGTPEELFDGVSSMVTADGHRIVYAKMGHSGIFSRSLDGDPATNPEEKLVDDYRPPGADLNPFPDGLYYISWNGAGKPRTIRFYSYAQKKSVDVTAVSGHINDTPGLTVSPDRHRLAYTQLTGTGTDLTMIEFQ